MIKGIGTDIVEIERIKRAIERHPHFVGRVFTPQEQGYCLSRKRPYLHFAVRFAAKEAVLKALGTGFQGLRWTDVEIVRNSSGKPLVNLLNGAAQIAHQNQINKVLISLSFSHNNAIASAIAFQDSNFR